MADEAELAFVATMRDEASRTAREARRQIESTTGTTQPITTPVRLRDEATGALNAIRGRLDSASREWQTTGRGLTRGLTLPIIGFGTAGLAASVQFSRGMGDVASLLPGNTARVEELRDAVKSTAEESGQGLDVVSRGLYQTLSAFGDTADTAKILAANAKTARAGAAEVSDAIALTSAVTKTYGDTSAKAVGKAADLALLTVRLGQTTFPELAGSIGMVTPIAKNLNATQEELFATMATFTGVTGGASEVSTQLRGAMQALMAPTADAAKAIKSAGYENGAALVKSKGLAGAITFLADEADRTGKPLQSYIGSIEGQTIALGLAGAQGKSYAKNLRQMSKAQGATDEAFKASTTGVGENAFAWDQAKVRASEFAGELGDGLAPALLDALDAAEPLLHMVEDVAHAFADADPQTQRLVVTVGALAAATGPAVWTLGSLGRGVSGLLGGVSALSGMVGTGTGKLRAWRNELAATETRAAALGRASRVAGGVAGIGALGIGASTSNKGLQTLANAGGGALLGFSVAGPIGAAVGGTAGALLTLARNANTAKDAATVSKASWDGLAETLNGVTGATTGATRAFVYDKLERAGVLKVLEAEGVARRDAVSALLGEPAARAKVAAAVAQQRTALEGLETKLEAVKNQEKAAQTVGGAGYGAGSANRTAQLKKQREELEAQIATQRNLISSIQGGIGAVDRETAAQRRRADAVNEYDELLAGVKRRGKIVTYLEAAGIPRSAKAVARMQATLNLTPKRVTTVLEALGIEVNRKRVRQLVADMKGAGNTKVELRGFSEGVKRSTVTAQNEASTGGKRVARNLEEPVRKARPTMATYLRALSSGTSSAQSSARTGAAGVGANLKSGTLAGLSGFGSVLAATMAAGVRQAINAAKAEAKIQSPSRETMYIGQMLGDGLYGGWNRSAPRTIAAARRTSREILGVLLTDLVGGEEKVGNNLDRLNKRIESFYNAQAATQIRAAKRSEKRARTALAAARKRGDKAEVKRLTRVVNQRERNVDKVTRTAERAAAQGIKSTTKAIRGQVAALRANAVEYDKYAGQLADARQRGVEFGQSLKDYANVANVQVPNEAPVTAGFILQDLKAKLAQVTAFRANLAKLRGRLDQDMIDELEAGGVEAGGAAAAALVAASKEQLDAINSTNRSLNAQADAAGTESVAGLVKGLLAQISDVEAAGKKIADALRKSIRKELGIRSPSRVTAQLGRYTGQGMALGLLDSARDAEQAAGELARRVTAAASPALGELSTYSSRYSVAPVAIQSANVVTIRHEIVSPDGSVSSYTAAQVADMIARDPRSAERLERALVPARRRGVANTIHASD